MSDRVERRLLEMLGGPEKSPYGNPIPGLEELGLAETPVSEAEISVLEAMDSGVTSATVSRIGENPQALEGFLELAHAIGLLPGAMISFAAEGERVSLATATGSVSIPVDSARHVFVTNGLARGR